MPPDDDERDIGSPDPEDDQKESKLAPDDDKKHKGGLQFDDDDDEPRTGGLQFDDEPAKGGLPIEFDDDDEHLELAPADDVQKPLEEAEDLVRRARLVSDALFKEARRMPEYKQVLATRERCAQFERTLLSMAWLIDFRLDTHLPADVVREVAERLANTIAAWEHSPGRQQERQQKQAASRRRRNRGRDLQIVRIIENGESQRKVAAQFRISRGAVRNVIERHRRENPS